MIAKAIELATRLPWTGDRQRASFYMLWLFIAFVSVHDLFLTALWPDVLMDLERNPLGRYLIEVGDGGVWLFLHLKGAGTVAACTCLLLIQQYWSRYAFAVAAPVALFQLWLLLYLSLADGR